jgi:hypothetical protein
MITDEGDVTFAVAIPMAGEAQLTLAAALALEFPDINAQLALALQFTPTLTSNIGELLAILQGIIDGINQLIAAGMTGISVDLSASIQAQAILDLQFKLGQLSVWLAFALSFGSLLDTGGVRLLSFTGTKDAFGSELQTALGAGTNAANAVVLYTETPATWTAMQSLFATG